MKDVEVQVDFYKLTGKWYAGGRVEIGDARLWKGDLYSAIIKNQQILKPGWEDHFIVVVNDLPELDTDPNYHEFFKAIFFPKWVEKIFRNVYYGSENQNLVKMIDDLVTAVNENARREHDK